MTFLSRFPESSTDRSTLLAVTLLAPAIALALGHGRAQGGGRPVGSAVFSSTDGGVQVKVQVAGLKPGAHGFHVHAAGLCEGPDFKSAAGHFNPAGKMLGLDSPAGHHGGDMPNLQVGADGNGTATTTLAGVTLGEGETSLFHAGGTAVVIHADADDGKTDPAGNAGARIACGVVRRGT